MLTIEQIEELVYLSGDGRTRAGYSLISVPENVFQELIAAARRDADVRTAWGRYQRGELSREEFEGTVAERAETPGEGMARVVEKQNARHAAASAVRKEPADG